ncbi:MAG: glycosyl transferase, partial [Flavobacteriales bacterium]|nr:glycosyl transferase [Flavobacteriales bacterium]
NDVSKLFDKEIELFRKEFTAKNIEKIQTLYTWDKIIDDYENLFIKLAK